MNAHLLVEYGIPAIYRKNETRCHICAEPLTEKNRSLFGKCNLCVKAICKAKDIRLPREDDKARAVSYGLTKFEE